MGIAGATVFRGVEGFGETAQMHRAGLFTHDQPVVVPIVESSENIDRVLEAVGGMTDTGLAAITHVEAIRTSTGRRGTEA